jgi:hypothetical protein
MAEDAAGEGAGAAGRLALAFAFHLAQDVQQVRWRDVGDR